MDGRQVSNLSYISHHSGEDIREMLKAIGVDDVLDLYRDIPEKYILKTPPDIGDPLTEQEVYEKIVSMLSKNTPRLKVFLGGGVWPHYIPAAVKQIVSRSEFLTSYTPYQPEASQGMLTALFEFQSLAADLYGVDVVNSSMYDWSTAVGEAFRMAMRYTGRNKIVYAGFCGPERVRIAQTYVEPMEGRLVRTPMDGKGNVEMERLKDAVDGETAAVYVENPTYLGSIVGNVEEVGEVAHDAGALYIVGCEPTSLGLLKPPGEYGADIVVGEGQPLGLPVSFGGPLLGILGCNLDRRLLHNMPGRLVGMTETLKDGRRAFTMVLRAREQDIRREKATSNICTNQALCAVAAAAYLSLLGKNGLRKLARHIFDKTAYFIERLSKVYGVEAPLVDAPHYMEFTYRVKGLEPRRLLKSLLDKGYVAGLVLGGRFPEIGEGVLTCVTEVHSIEDIEGYATVLEGLV